MLRILSGLFSLLLIQGCAFELETGANDESDAINPNVYERKQNAMPPSYIACNDSFYWSMTNFEDSMSLDEDAGSELRIVAQQPTSGPIRSGYSTRNTFELTNADAETCYDIHRKIAGYTGVLEYRLMQFFDREKAINLARNNQDFQKLDGNQGLLMVSAFRVDDKGEKEELMYELSMPMMVTCDNAWMIKQDPAALDHAIIKTPDGECNFSVTDYAIESPSGEKLTIALKGFFSKDKEDPDQRIRIHVTDMGFKRGHQ